MREFARMQPLSFCQDDAHRIGEWVRKPASAVDKSFVSCSAGPFDAGFARKDLFVPANTPTWLYKGEAIAGCNCDAVQRMKILGPKVGRNPNVVLNATSPRHAELFAWHPTNCRLRQWDARLFCRALGTRAVAFIGDSTIRQSAYTLWNLIRAGNGGCDDQITFASSDTLLGGCLGNYGRGPSLLDNVEVLTRNGTRLDIVVMSAGAHVYKGRCDYNGLYHHGGSCAQGPMRCTHPEALRFKADIKRHAAKLAAIE